LLRSSVSRLVSAASLAALLLALPNGRSSPVFAPSALSARPRRERAFRGPTPALKGPTAVFWGLHTAFPPPPSTRRVCYSCCLCHCCIQESGRRKVYPGGSSLLWHAPLRGLLYFPSPLLSFSTLSLSPLSLFSTLPPLHPSSSPLFLLSTALMQVLHFPL